MENQTVADSVGDEWTEEGWKQLGRNCRTGHGPESMWVTLLFKSICTHTHNVTQLIIYISMHMSIRTCWLQLFRSTKLDAYVLCDWNMNWIFDSILEKKHENSRIPLPPPRECLYIQQEAGYLDTTNRIKKNRLSMHNKILQYIQ